MFGFQLGPRALFSLSRHRPVKNAGALARIFSPATLGKDRTSKAMCVANHADLSSLSRLQSLAPAASERSFAS